MFANVLGWLAVDLLLAGVALALGTVLSRFGPLADPAVVIKED